MEFSYPSQEPQTVNSYWALDFSGCYHDIFIVVVDLNSREFSGENIKIGVIFASYIICKE